MLNNNNEDNKKDKDANKPSVGKKGHGSRRATFDEIPDPFQRSSASQNRPKDPVTQTNT